MITLRPTITVDKKQGVLSKLRKESQIEIHIFCSKIKKIIFLSCI